MSKPFDSAADLKDAPRVEGARLRPKDAATLILVRRDGRGPRVLMGRRAEGHVFMASKWVFPGGRIDRADFRAPYATDLRPEVAAAVGRTAPLSRVRALALAAVRETFEETGLLLARPAPAAAAAPGPGATSWPAAPCPTWRRSTSWRARSPRPTASGASTPASSRPTRSG